MVTLFERMNLPDRAYERVVSQIKKPLLNEARGLLDTGLTQTDEAKSLERRLRMKLPEFIQNETAIENIIRLLDDTRSQIVMANEAFAREISEAAHPGNAVALEGALHGLYLSL